MEHYELKISQLIDNELPENEQEGVFLFLSENEEFLMMEFLLHGLAEYSLISKQHVEFGLQFKDMISTMFTNQDDDEEFTDEDYRY